MSKKIFTFTFASAATATNKQYVGPHDRAFVVTSAMTNWNAGAGNANISVRGGLSLTDEHADIQSMSVATMTIKGVHPMPYPGLHFMSLGLGTAATGSAANTIDVVVYADSDDI